MNGNTELVKRQQKNKQTLEESRKRMQAERRYMRYMSPSQKASYTVTKREEYEKKASERKAKCDADIEKYEKMKAEQKQLNATNYLKALGRLRCDFDTLSDPVIEIVYKICCIAPNADNLMKLIIDNNMTTLEQALTHKDVQCNEVWLYILCLNCITYMNFETSITYAIQSKNTRVFKKLTMLNHHLNSDAELFTVQKAIEAKCIDMVKHCIAIWPNVIQTMFDKNDDYLSGKKSQYLSADSNDEMNHIILNELSPYTIENEFGTACYHNDVCTMKIILNGHIDIDNIDNILDDFSDTMRANYIAFNIQNTPNTDV